MGHSILETSLNRESFLHAVILVLTTVAVTATLILIYNSFQSKKDKINFKL